MLEESDSTETLKSCPNLSESSRSVRNPPKSWISDPDKRVYIFIFRFLDYKSKNETKKTKKPIGKTKSSAWAIQCRSRPRVFCKLQKIPSSRETKKSCFLCFQLWNHQNKFLAVGKPKKKLFLQN